MEEDQRSPLWGFEGVRGAARTIGEKVRSIRGLLPRGPSKKVEYEYDSNDEKRSFFDF